MVETPKKGRGKGKNNSLLTSKITENIYITNENVETNAPVLSGYLHLKNTGELTDLEEHPTVKSILETWTKARQSNYGDPTSKPAQVVRRSLYSLAAAEEYQEILLQETPVEASEQIPKSVVPSLVWLNAMVRLYHCRNELFDGDRTAPVISTKDLNRAYLYLRWYWKSQNASRKGKDGGNRTVTPAIQPNFRNNEGTTVPEEAETNETPAAAQGWEPVELRHANVPSMLGIYSGQNEEDEATMGHLADQLDRDLGSAVFFDDDDHPKARRRLTRKQLEMTLEYISQQANVLSDTSTCKSDQTVQLLVTGAQAMTEATSNAARGQLDEEEASASFWRLQEALNESGAQMPSYEEACATLGMDSNDLAGGKVVPEGRISNKEPHHELHLEPWQVSA
jgi:hypothetical protein